MSNSLVFRFSKNVLALALLFAVAGCNGDSGNGGSGNGKSGNANDHGKPVPSTATRKGTGPISIVCTTGMVADMVRNVGGDQVNVSALMGEGVDPHLYKPTPKDQTRLTKGDMLFYSGLHLEANLIEVLVSLSHQNIPVHAITQTLDDKHDKRLLETDSGHDPHVWNDPEIWSDCIDEVLAALSRFDKDNAETYAANAKAYQEQIAELVTFADEQFGSIPEEQRVLVTAHDAFGYLASRFKFEVMPIQGVTTEAEASLPKINGLVKTISERKIKAVFAETSVNDQYQKALIDGCARNDHTLVIGGSLYSDAMGGEGSGADTYLTMFRKNVETITGALK